MITVYKYTEYFPSLSLSSNFHSIIAAVLGLKALFKADPLEIRDKSPFIVLQ